MIKQRQNYFKLRDSRFRLDSKKKFFVVGVVGHWNRLNRDVVDASFLEGQLGWGSEKHILVKGVFSVHGRGIATR